MFFTSNWDVKPPAKVLIVTLPISVVDWIDEFGFPAHM